MKIIKDIQRTNEICIELKHCTDVVRIIQEHGAEDTVFEGIRYNDSGTPSYTIEDDETVSQIVKLIEQSYLERIAELESELFELDKDTIKTPHPLNTVGLSVRAYNAIIRRNSYLNINYLEDMEGWDNTKIFKMRNIGKETAREIANKLDEYGIPHNIKI